MAQTLIKMKAEKARLLDKQMAKSTINHLARHGLVRGLLKLNFKKDHLCYACAMGKSKKKLHKPKSEDTNQEKHYLLHMDLCGLIRVASVNGNQYILVIVDDYSRFAWVKCLRSKDEALDFIIKFLKMIQLRLKAPIRRIRMDNRTEFVNQTLREYYEKVGISHETSVVRSLQKNGVVKRRNRTLIEVACTMLIYAKALLFLWAEAVATTCYTQIRSIIRLRHVKTPYEVFEDHVDPTLLNDFKMAIEGNGDPPVPGLRTMEELLPGDNANKHLDKFLHVTQSIKVNGVTDDALRLYLFPHSLTHHAIAWFDRLPRNSINTFEQMAKMFLGKYFPPSMVTKLRNEITNFRQRPDESLFEAWECYTIPIDRCPNHNMLPVTQIDTFYNGLNLRHHDTINAAAGGTFMKRRPEECYDLIKNMSAHHNDWDTSAQRIAHNCETCGGPHSYNDCQATVGQTHNVYVMGAYQGGNSYQPQGNRNRLSCRSDNYLGPPAFNQNQSRNNQNQNFQNQNKNQGNNHAIPQGNNQRRNQFFQGAGHGQNRLLLIKHRLTKPQANEPILKNMQTNMTSLTNSNLELKNMFSQFMKMNTASSSGLGTLPSNTVTNPKEDLKGITTQSGNAYQGPTIPTTSSSLPKIENPIPNFEPVVALVAEPIIAPVAETVSAPKPNPKLSIPYPSRLHDQKLRDKANDQKEKKIQIFKDLDFSISFADALILMPKFGPTIKSLLINKEKRFELARTPLNEHCSVVLLKKLPKKLGDPGKFLIPCDFLGMDECLALADHGVSINLMPLSVWNKLSLPEVTPTLMTLELADRLISLPIGVAKDVFVKVGKFHFPDHFVVVDFDADPRVPLILERSFLKTGRALIDVYNGELTLRVNNEAVTFNLDQTSSPTPYYDPIVSTSSPTLTSFEDSNFLLEEVDAFLALEDDPTLSEIGHSYYDTGGDILLLEAFLNDDPSLPPPTQGMYLPKIQKELRICEAKNDKSSFDEPPEVELKDLPPHLEYVFLEGDDKLPVIITKDLSVEEKAALIKVLKSHKRAITWKLSDIKGINPEFYAHKILMEDDFEPVVQHQRRVNPKIHEVIKKEVLKLLDSGLIYTISDSPWVMQCTWHVPNVYDGYLSRYDRKNNGSLHGRLLGLWEKSHFMVKEGIVLGHKISKNWIEVDKAKVDVIAKLPHPNTVKGAVLGKRKTKHFQPIHYASETMTDSQAHYTTTEKELLAVVYAFEKFWPYHVLSKSIVCTDHSALKYLFSKQDAKPRLLRWVLLLQEFDITVRDKRGAENLAADHLSRLENPHQCVLEKKEINETFPLETLNMGIDFIGTFLSSRGNKCILMAVDYLSKWVEAKALPTNDSRVVCKFLKSLFARFGTPRAIISDHDMHFYNDQFTKVMLKYGVTHRLATAYYPQTSGQVSDSEDESENKAQQIVPSFVQSSKQVKSSRHSVQHVETSIPAATPKPTSPKPASSGKRRNRKACFVFKSVDHLIKDCDYHAKKMAQPIPRNHAHRGNHKQYAPLTHTKPQKHMVPAVVLTQSKPVSITAVRPVSAAVPKIKVTRPIHAPQIVTKSKSPIRRHLTRIPSPMTSNSPPRVTTVKAPVVSAAEALWRMYSTIIHAGLLVAVVG
nr:reverse transcriptase domain-containing protein [Tanacetum cinerariifolium]